MISSGKVTSDASSVSSLFSSYTNAISNLESNSVWEGKSKNNAISQARNFVSEYSSPIEGQMNDFASAIDKYEEYKQLKENIEKAEKERDNVLRNDSDADVSSYDREISNMKEKKDKLKSEIEELLANVTSRRLELSSASIEIESFNLGSFVNYYQGDYSNVTYGSGSMAATGCGPTSMAMVLTYLTGETVDPPTAAAYASNHGHYVWGAGTSWGYFDDISSQYGIECEESGASASKIVQDLSAGKVMICSMTPGDFTSAGHFIVLKGITNDGKVIVADPASRDRSSVTWDASRVASQCANMWTFDVDKTTYVA